jgi:hypothetical protein
MHAHGYLVARQSGAQEPAGQSQIFGDEAEEEENAHLLINELFEERQARRQTPPAVSEKPDWQRHASITTTSIASRTLKRRSPFARRAATRHHKIAWFPASSTVFAKLVEPPRARRPPQPYRGPAGEDVEESPDHRSIPGNSQLPSAVRQRAMTAKTANA